MSKKTKKSREMKGGEEQMAQVLTEPIILECRYCGKKMPPSLYRRQAESWLESHENNCKEKPSKKENAK